MFNDTSDPNDDLLTTREAAAVLHLAPYTLAIWRCDERYALPYTRAGRKVLYRRGDLVDFLKRNRVEPKRRR
jgi:hypothetical protein